ncbi:hypothetical protein ABH953_004954 [Bacillus sp. RC236]
MKTRELLTTEQREYFYEIPEHMDEREILRYYTISDEELQIINKQRGAANRLGFAIQIAYLRFPGRPLSAKLLEQSLIFSINTHSLLTGEMVQLHPLMDNSLEQVVSLALWHK